MSSRFDTFFKNHARPFLAREFNQPVVLILTNNEEIHVMAFVSTEDIPTEDGFSDLQGKLSVATDQLYSLMDRTRLGEITLVRYRNELYDVYAHNPDQCGGTVFNIRRRYEEQQHSNFFDITHNQLPLL
jgi:hypothetical protein